MNTLMIVNRIENWFDITDVELDECYTAIQILKKLFTRKKFGLDYDRFKLAITLYNRNSAETIDIIDQSIALLISRNLITIDNKKGGKRKLLITELGEQAYSLYEDEMKK